MGQISDSIAGNYIHSDHIIAFKRVAKRCRVWILVRQYNPASGNYIGISGYQPKRLDCKAKTAGIDLPKTMPHRGTYRLAGLVVDPEIQPKAFPGRDVSKAWRDFQANYYKPSASEQRAYLPTGKTYTVQLDPAHDHYGCIVSTRYGQLHPNNYIYVYGDYDLYGIVSEDDPSNNVFAPGVWFGKFHHSKGREFFDVQNLLNIETGIAMILHGSQEKYSGHTDEDIVVFWPDGQTISECKGRAQIERMYRETFQGRLAKGKTTPTTPDGGSWQRL